MRIEGWETLLHQHIEEARHSVFAWGENDCALWCAKWIAAITSVDLTGEWKGLYSTEEGLRDLMQSRGYRSVEEIADHTAFPIMDRAFAQRGDIVLHPHGCLGICNGLVSYFLTEQGFTKLRTMQCIKAWKIS